MAVVVIIVILENAVATVAVTGVVLILLNAAQSKIKFKQILNTH